MGRFFNNLKHTPSQGAAAPWGAAEGGAGGYILKLFKTATSFLIILNMRKVKFLKMS